MRVPATEEVEHSTHLPSNRRADRHVTYPVLSDRYLDNFHRERNIPGHRHRIPLQYVPSASMGQHHISVYHPWLPVQDVRGKTHHRSWHSTHHPLPYRHRAFSDLVPYVSAYRPQWIEGHELWPLLRDVHVPTRLLVVSPDEQTDSGRLQGRIDSEKVWWEYWFSNVEVRQMVLGRKKSCVMGESPTLYRYVLHMPEDRFARMALA
ncbi:hypothetical protein T265_11047 [Opisthorchis viverrini]|uniref:Uncharacterized protein n=1 Tax=Opisthorchis viverrini TaxID=6198 RepID=A0A074ZAY3_OPIVI|nr:hypothetical protein T265_11047 [Opisthorchis viverrini]KER20400.1 hypothetical protein T265_11047 [Opisthorchis viverrini]